MKTISLQLILLLALSAMVACNKNESKDTAEQQVNKHKETQYKNAVDTEEDSGYDEYLTPHEEVFKAYTFKFGYEKYDDEFSNPGYLQVLKNGKILFKDTFKGEGEVHMHPLGYHDLSGKKLVFELGYGIDACDYTQTSRYYVIDANDRVQFIKDYWSGSGGDGYSTRYYNAIFPKDSLGKANTLTIVEGITFHEHDQPDWADTTHVIFSENTFSIKKISNNLDKE